MFHVGPALSQKVLTTPEGGLGPLQDTRGGPRTPAGPAPLEDWLSWEDAAHPGLAPGPWGVALGFPDAIPAKQERPWGGAPWALSPSWLWRAGCPGQGWLRPWTPCPGELTALVRCCGPGPPSRDLGVLAGRSCSGSYVAGEGRARTTPDPERRACLGPPEGHKKPPCAPGTQVPSP